MLYAPCAQAVHLFLISANTRPVLQGAYQTWGPCLGPPLLSLAQTLDSGDSQSRVASKAMGRSNGQIWKVKCCLLLLPLLFVPLFYGCYCCCSCCCHMYLDTLAWHAPNHLGICPSRATIWRGIHQVNLFGKYNTWRQAKEGWDHFDQTYCQVATRNGVGFARTNRLGSGPGFAHTHGPAFGRSGSLAFWGRSGPAAWLQGATEFACTNRPPGPAYALPFRWTPREETCQYYWLGHNMGCKIPGNLKC